MSELEKSFNLVDKAYEAVRTRLVQRGSIPSEDHFQGIKEILEKVQAMADGNLYAATYLSSLPTGIGKSTTVEDGVRCLLSMPMYEHVGVIIFLAQVDFINQMIEGMELEQNQYAVIVSKDYWDKVPLGNHSPQSARVLFTTQKQLDQQLSKHGSFTDINDFYYNGKPREVRIWDEACSPTRELTINRANLLLVAGTLLKDRKAEPLGEMLIGLCNELKAIQKGESPTIDIPPIEDYGVSYKDGLTLIRGEEDKRTWEMLWELSGLRTKGRYEEGGNTALNYTTWMPEDLNPLLVLDASGRHSKRYMFWAQSGALFSLHSPDKEYDNLTIYHWDRGSGRQTWKNKSAFEEIADAIAREINKRIPDNEDVLIVHYKPKGRIRDLEEATRKQVNEWRKGRVHFLTWGRHTATNEFRDCKYVFLASLYNVPDSVYEAALRGSKQMDIMEDINEEEFWDTKSGEKAHNLYQAACRGAIRKADGSSCPEAYLYVIFATKEDTGTRDDILPKVFPKAKVEKWYPVIKLSPNHQRLCNYVADMAMPGATVELKKSKVAEDMGFDNKNWGAWFTDKVCVYLEQELGITFTNGHGRIWLTRKETPRSLSADMESYQNLRALDRFHYDFLRHP